jgi:hypothetical protein
MYEARSHQTRAQQFARQRVRTKTYLQIGRASVKYTTETIWIQIIIDIPPALTNATENQINGKVILSERRGMCTFNLSPRSHASLKIYTRNQQYHLKTALYTNYRILELMQILLQSVAATPYDGKTTFLLQVM